MLKRIVLVLLLPLASLAAPADEVLERARELLGQHHPQAAYELLSPLQAERAGDPQFDYLLGVAALDSGHKSEAVFAFERVLAVDPEHKLARAEIARAYFELKEYETARGEFTRLKDRHLPPEVQATLERYLSAIRTATGEQRTRWHGYLNLGLGYDSNVNSATGNGEIVVPAISPNPVPLNPNGTAQDDLFTLLGGGIDVQHRLSPDWTLSAAVNVYERWTQRPFSTSAYNGNIALTWQLGDHQFTLGVQGEQFFLDRNAYRNAGGLLGQWRYSFDNRTLGTLYTQATRLSFPTQDRRDADRYLGGVGVSHALMGKHAPVVYGSLYGGTEDERHDNVPHIGFDFVGLRAGGQFLLRHDIALHGTFTYEYRDYGGPEPLFFKTHQDDYYRLTAGADYRFGEVWRLTPEFSYTRNDANIPLYDYDRWILGLTLRRDFN